MPMTYSAISAPLRENNLRTGQKSLSNLAARFAIMGRQLAFSFRLSRTVFTPRGWDGNPGNGRIPFWIPACARMTMQMRL
jgi:hypothetical protein